MNVDDEQAFYEMRRKSGRQPKQPVNPDGLTEEQRRELAQALADSKQAADAQTPWPGEE